MLHVIDAKYIGDYKISVEFNDGCRFVAHTITWPNGVDFAPEFIKSLK